MLIRGPVAATQYWRYGPPTLGAAPSWYEWEYDANRNTGAKLKAPGIWELYLRDGAPGDDDGLLNGVIRDPGGLAEVFGAGEVSGGSATSGDGVSAGDAAVPVTSTAPGAGPKPDAAAGVPPPAAGTTPPAAGTGSGVAADLTERVLAATGAPVAPTVLFAFELLCCGLALVRVGRRPRRAAGNPRR